VTALARRTVSTVRHTTSYLESGPSEGPLLIFVHGWPSLGLMWRHQLEHFASRGFHCVAPDMRGYGESSVPAERDAYSMREIAADLMELLQVLGAERALWIGHDLGSTVVWSIASHHPAACRGVVSLGVPYFAVGNAPATLIALVDRRAYPEEKYPAGQWDYQLFYERAFDTATAAFDADVRATIKALFRGASAADRGKPSPTARITRDGGWFGGTGRAPDVPLDTSVMTEDVLEAYVAAFSRNGFAGPDAWYVNADANLRYAAEAANGGRLTQPVLFLHAAFDRVCETVDSRLAEPMRRDCADLTERVLETGHWMPEEKPAEVNAALEAWFSARFA
jgi:pimeloyl-ACP methyl ester carboxylesterase